MCSILGILDIGRSADRAALRNEALARSALQRHRGPDWNGVYSDEHVILVHERLAIVGITSGAHPLRSEDRELALAVNGEIYNHRELRAALPGYAWQSDSDCEVINAMYRASGDGIDFLRRLNGIFAFVLWDAKQRRYLVARDPIGVCPL